MKTLIEIQDADIAALDELASRSKTSRSALIRQAIANFLKAADPEVEDEGYGLWGKRKVDGLAYQKQIRSEW